MRHASRITTAAGNIRAVFGKAGKVIVARAMNVFADYEIPAAAPLDAGNPFWDFSLEADSNGAGIEGIQPGEEPSLRP